VRLSITASGYGLWTEDIVVPDPETSWFGQQPNGGSPVALPKTPNPSPTFTCTEYVPLAAGNSWTYRDYHGDYHDILLDKYDLVTFRVGEKVLMHDIEVTTIEMGGGERGYWRVDAEGFKLFGKDDPWFGNDRYWPPILWPTGMRVGNAYRNALTSPATVVRVSEHGSYYTYAGTFEDTINVVFDFGGDQESMRFARNVGPLHNGGSLDSAYVNGHSY